MKNNLIGLTVALTVGIILVGSLLVPIITAVTDETRTYINEGIPYATPDDDTHTIVVSSDGTAFSITVDGEDSEVPDLTLYGSATLVYCENVNIRLATSGAITGQGQNAAGTISGYTLGTVDADTSITITISGTDVTSGSYSFADARAFICPDGEYVLCSNPCVDSDSTIMIIGGTTTLSGIGTVALAGIGTVDEFSASVLRGNGTVDTVTINTTEVDGNLVRVDSIVINVSYNDTDYAFTYTYFLAPASITYDNPDYVGSVAVPLMSAIVVVTILALVMVAARAVTRD